MHSALHHLQKTFGYSVFRENQEAIVSSVLAQKDTFVLMPTGGGKSICYQLPALMLGGLTVVISPLIALMKDQVDALRLNGVAAAFLNSTLSSSEQHEIRNQLSQNQLKLLYLAPERLLRTESEFILFLRTLQISLIAIDEAHCISHWGHDFRPEYLMLSRLKKEFPSVPIIALTATADQLTRRDIVDKLALHHPVTFVSSFNRPNIRYTVEPKRKNFERLLEFLDKRKNDSGIIYCLSRASTENLAGELQAHGFNAVAYHAGLDRDIRARNQESFLKDEVRIVVATIAFGMGIDKSNVRFVVHMDLPKSMEGYYQETGRAGRDGLESEALLFYGYGDVAKLKGFAEVEGNSEQTRNNLAKLDKMARFGELTTCRRKFILNYFDETAADYCGNCDVCLTAADRFDGTIIAQKALSAVTRLQERFGLLYVIDFLRGSQAEKIKPEHREIKTFGAGTEISRDNWIQYMNELIQQGYLGKSDGQYPLLRLTTRSTAVLNGSEKVWLTQSKSIVETIREDDAQYESGLLSRLKVLRRMIAESENVPAYIVLSDASLLELATFLPQNGDELTRISGFGEVKLRKYGDQFLNEVRSYCHKEGLSSRIQLKKGRIRRTGTREKKDDTRQLTYSLYRQGLIAEEIAFQRRLSVSTIESHLAYFIERGDLNVTELVSGKAKKEIEAAIRIHGDQRAGLLKEAVGDSISYGEIHAVLAHRRWMSSETQNQ